MSVVARFIESGILDMYVLGATTREENQEVERMAVLHLEVRKEISEIRTTVNLIKERQEVPPSPTLKPFLLAMIDYMERRRNGEEESCPALLSQEVGIPDYQQYLDRPDMALPDDFKDFYAKIIGHTPQATTAIVWMKEGAPFEIHNDMIEQFLVVEGACLITMVKQFHLLFKGDYLSIPINHGHSVDIISSIPCKVILQRVAVNSW